MNNAETKDYLLKWVDQTHSQWAWPTDYCGYDQHIKFVEIKIGLGALPMSLENL